MEIIARVSNGTNMDQIYLPKNRYALPVGSYVFVKPVETSPQIKKFMKPILYGIKSIEPIKMTIAESIFECVEKQVEEYQNIIITGSFVEKGFCFQDIDVVLITEKKVEEEHIKKKIEDSTGIKAHIIVLTAKTLLQGISTDPLYQSMISTCISRKRFLYKTRKKLLYKILDLHLLRSEIVLETYDGLDGDEKYYWTRNMIAIHLFLKKEKVSNSMITEEIKNIFNIKEISEIKKNIIDKKTFLKKYKRIYDITFKKIMEGIRNESKQKQNN
ncbi:hypothetical protein HY483_00335 [Candidatus Woesearchaeota archaeon]|nr:hypothetical protein [Candidatus Woesearchaeota archaeon]